MNEKSFESRRVRTQPCTKMFCAGAVLFSASLSEIGERVLSIHLKQTLNVQHSTRLRKAAAWEALNVESGYTGKREADFFPDRCASRLPVKHLIFGHRRYPERFEERSRKLTA